VVLKPCLGCGQLSPESYCPAHTRRRGSTRQWRKLRARVLMRDGQRCQLCGAPAADVDHIVPVSESVGFPLRL
jgi:5-methylcytosine-specific restriction endonuclease McrA